MNNYSNLIKIAESNPININSLLGGLEDYKHLFMPAAAGAGLGGLGGLLATPLTEHPEREKRNWIRNMLLGVLAGGAAGVGAGHFAPELTKNIGDQITSRLPFGN